MRSSRHRVKSPVGNKVKRGAELEGTPRTPRTMDYSPVRSIGANGLQEQNDHSRPTVSRKQQNWSATKYGFATFSARNDDTPENPLAPRHQERLREQGVETAELALSPICVNAITAGSYQLGERNSSKERFIDNTTKALSKQSVSPTVGKFRPDTNLLRNHFGFSSPVCVSRRKEGVDVEDAFPLTEGSCPSSPECRPSCLSGGPNVVIWNNAAFQPGSVANDMFISRDSGSYSSSSSASSSKWRMLQSNAQGVDLRKLSNKADAESRLKDYATDADSQPSACGIAEVEGFRDEFVDGIMQFDCSQFITEVVCAKKKDDDADIWGRSPDCSTGNSLNNCVARKVLFVPREIGLDQSVIKTSSGPQLEAGISVKLPPSTEGVEDETRFECRSLFAQEKAQNYKENAVESHLFEAEKGYQEVKECQAAKEKEATINAIEKEIQRLKKRLSELQLQRQRMHAEGRSGDGGEKASKASFKEGMKMLVSGSGKDGKIDAGRGGNKIGAPQGTGLSRRHASLGSSSSISRDDIPATHGRKQLAEGSCKSEIVKPRGRRLVKRPGMRTNEGGAPQSRSAACGSTPSPPAEGLAAPPVAASPVSEKKNVFRRLSLSSAIATVPASSPKPVPRFVSSRYSQPPTPDPPPSKKRHRASSTPRNPSTSNSSPSPLKKLTTIRSGYPSPSGFSTPHKARSKTPIPPGSHLPLATTTSPRSAPRVQVFKSTAALSVCLESLVQDANQFFKRYPRTSACSPDVAAVAKSSCSHNATQQACSAKLSVRRRQMMLPLETISSSKPFETPQKSSLNFVASGDGLDSERRTLPRINTTRLLVLSPRDSGCVKRMPDREKKQLFFARDERDIQSSNEPALEAN